MSSDNTYGGPSGANNSTIEYAENAIIDGVSGKKVFPIDLPPTGQTNPSSTLAYDGDGNLSTITKVINGVSYQKTLGYTDGVLTDISVWVQL